MKKFAWVSHVLPPQESGQCMVMYRLLKDLPADAYCLIGQQDYDDPRLPNYSARLPCRYYNVPFPGKLSRFGRFAVVGWTHFLNVRLAIAWRARRIERILREEKCEAVLACSSGMDLTDLPAAYRASRAVGIPFYAYLMDYYSAQWLAPNSWNPMWRPYFARTLEPRFLRGAAGVIVPNEFLSDELRRKYGVRATLVRNPLDVSDYAADSAAPRSAAGQDGPADGEVRIVYTGAVNISHYDSFRDLVAAIRSLNAAGGLGPRTRIALHLYTSTPPEELARQGVQGPVHLHGHRAMADMPLVQRGADILFLPLAFASPYPDLIRTSSPGKMGEYLASGRPVLVHTPPDAFPAWFFRHYECGLVSDRRGPEGVAHLIRRLLDDAPLGQRLTANAQAIARREFDTLAARTRFLDTIHYHPASARPAGPGQNLHPAPL